MHRTHVATVWAESVAVFDEPVKFEVEFDGFVPDIATDPVP